MMPSTKPGQGGKVSIGQNDPSMRLRCACPENTP